MFAPTFQKGRGVGCGVWGVGSMYIYIYICLFACMYIYICMYVLASQCPSRCLKQKDVPRCADALCFKAKFEPDCAVELCLFGVGVKNVFRFSESLASW